MRGQLNLFSFKPDIKVFYPTPLKLNKGLWKLIKKNDPRGYSFGRFDDFGRSGSKKFNRDCATVVIYRKRRVVGFCTISLYETKAPYLDVWVLPYYRDMGLGSILIKAAVEKAVELTGQYPDGREKHHNASWDKTFRHNMERRIEEGKQFYEHILRPNHATQHNLFCDDTLRSINQATIRRLITSLSANINIDSAMMTRCWSELRALSERTQ